jgi:hypothetical protein
MCLSVIFSLYEMERSVGKIDFVGKGYKWPVERFVI